MNLLFINLRASNIIVTFSAKLYLPRAEILKLYRRLSKIVHEVGMTIKTALIYILLFKRDKKKD